MRHLRPNLAKHFGMWLSLTVQKVLLKPAIREDNLSFVLFRSFLLDVAVESNN